MLRGRLCKSQMAILLYYRIGDPTEYPWSIPPVSTQDFENQIRYLCQTRELLSLDELTSRLRENQSLPSKAAVITFDDGYKNCYTNAYPILKKYHVPATIFLTTGHIGTGKLFWWDKVSYIAFNVRKTLKPDDPRHRQSLPQLRRQLKRLSEENKNLMIEEFVEASGIAIPPLLGKELILSWDEVREMNSNSITIGAHSVTHPILTRLSPEQARSEIIQSKRDIEERVGCVVTVFAYPNGLFGDFDAQTVGFVKEAGFHCAVTGVPRMINVEADLYQLGRISIVGNFDMFKLFLSGLYSDLKLYLV